MKKSIFVPTIKKQIITSNRVRLEIESNPSVERSSNRIDSRVVSVDYSEIGTDVTLLIHEGQRRIENPILIECISELEDERESVRNDALFHLKNDIDLLCKSIGATSTTDRENIFTAIVDTRNQVLQHKPV